ncbi:MAG TPA: ATP-binding protein [Polyangiaceae bacterium]
MPSNTISDRVIGPRLLDKTESDEHFYPSEAEEILAQLASAFFRNDGALGGLLGPGAPSRAATRIRASGEVVAEEDPDAEFEEAGIVSLTPKGTIQTLNAAALRIFGAREDELRGEPGHLLFAGATAGGFEPKSGVMLGRRRDGATFRMAVTASTLALETGVTTVLALRDVSELARVRAARQEAERRFRTLVEQIPAVTFMASLAEGPNEIYIGPQIEALLGYTQKEWLDDPVLWFRRMHPDDQERWNAEFARGCAVGGPFRADCRFFARDGRTVWVHGEARVVRDEAGNAQFIQGVAFDITEIKEAEQRMREAQEVLVRTEKLAAIGRLAASVGHELRNPLAAIRNAWFYLEKRVKGAGLLQADERVAQFAQVIPTEIDRCAKIIGELLDFSRERPLYRVPCPVPELVASALGVVVKPAAAIRVLLEVPDELPIPNLDADQFRQVLVNILQNALEAVDVERGVVTVVVREHDGLLVLEIGDNGRGMTPDVLRRIFEPLYTTKLRGTGLGLAIVDSIVKRHAGKLEVASQPGVGTTFSITVPIGDASSEPRPALGGAADLRR